MDSYFHKAIWRDLNGVTIEFYASVGRMRRYFVDSKNSYGKQRKVMCASLFRAAFFQFKTAARRDSFRCIVVLRAMLRNVLASTGANFIVLLLRAACIAKRCVSNRFFPMLFFLNL
jgi:hypothetical protein